MKIVVQPVYERESFSEESKQDFFDRKKFADNLGRLFSKTNSGLVISINAKWGDGKTAFVRQWIDRLKDDEVLIPIYYDAFKNDFTSDAFLSIAAAIQKNLPASILKRKGGSLYEGLVASTVTVAQDLIKIGAGVAVTNLTAGLVNGRDVVEKIGETVGSALSETVTYKAKERLQAHLQMEDDIAHYRSALSRLLDQNKGGRKIIFFIDELDRCRPDFSMQVIERVKHLFSVDSVIFVLVINKDQLVRSVMHAYGVSSDEANTYLQKFIHLETELPSISQSVVGSTANYIDSLIAHHEFSHNILGYNKDAFIELLGHKYLSMNPRSIERSFVLAAAALMTLEDEDEEEWKVLLLFFCAAIKVGRPSLYNKIKNGTVHVGVSTVADADEKFGQLIDKAFGEHRQKNYSNTVYFKDLPEICSRVDMFYRAEIEG